jgi:hypothetical protein
MAHFFHVVVACAQHVVLVASMTTRQWAPPELNAVGSVDALVDHSVVAKCSLREHASAELAILRSGLDESVTESSCANSMDIGPAGTMYMSFLRGLSLGESRPAVWVNGYPRSSTSTVLSMVSLGETVMDDCESDERTFSLFEPCHSGDEFAGTSCGDLLTQLLHCNFTGVTSLHGWQDPHSTSKHREKDPFSAAGATGLCKQADVVALKTISADKNLTNWEWLLQDTPELHILNVVRDPRGIYASWKMTGKFAKRIEAGTQPTIVDICDVFSQNIDFDHARVHTVVFEQLVSNPEETMRQAYRFMGMEFGERQKAWLNETFDASACTGHMQQYEDCHTSSGDVVEKWRSVLSKDELNLFTRTESCQRVLKHYGFGPM